MSLTMSFKVLMITRY